jgi:hypothetical protein
LVIEQALAKLNGDTAQVQEFGAFSAVTKANGMSADNRSRVPAT